MLLLLFVKVFNIYLKNWNSDQVNKHFPFLG